MPCVEVKDKGLRGKKGERNLKKVSKAILTIKEKIIDMYNILRDVNMKLCHLIRSRNDHYGHSYKTGDYK